MNTDESTIILFGFNGLFTAEVVEVYVLFFKTTVGDKGLIPSICKDPGPGKEMEVDKSFTFYLLLCNHLPIPTPTKMNCYIKIQLHLDSK